MFFLGSVIEVQLLRVDQFLLDFGAGLELILFVPGLAFAVVVVGSAGGVGLAALLIAQTSGLARVLRVGVGLGGL